MKKQSLDLIKEVLIAHYNSLQTEYQFLCHQLSLPPEYRKVEGEDEDLHKLAYDLSHEVADAENALEELGKIKPE